MTRREMLEMYSKIPEHAGDLYPLILDELERTKPPLLIEGEQKEDE